MAKKNVLNLVKMPSLKVICWKLAKIWLRRGGGGGREEGKFVPRHHPIR